MNSNKNNPKSQPIIIFMHIPKTAGSTLKLIFYRQFQPGEIFEFYFMKDKSVSERIQVFKYLQKAQKRQLKLVSGHIGFGLHQFIDHPCTYTTFFRHPIERIISYYCHLKATQKKIVENQSLEDFVEKCSGYAQNSMTKFLSGKTLDNQLNPSSAMVDNLNSNEMFELAKKNLENYFEIFGISERFNESLVLLQKAFGWNIALNYQKRNVAKTRIKRQDLSVNTVKIIEHFNEMDLQLYEYAKELFERKINAQNYTFFEDLKAIKQSNSSNFSTLHLKVDSTLQILKHRSYYLYRDRMLF
jgi:hypothetical protein